MRNPYHLGNVGDEVSRSGVMAAKRRRDPRHVEGTGKDMVESINKIVLNKYMGHRSTIGSERVHSTLLKLFFRLSSR